MLSFGVIDFFYKQNFKKPPQDFKKSSCFGCTIIFIFDFIDSRFYIKECECVDGNATDVKFKGNDQYWCCKTPNTTCTYRKCQGKKLPLSQQCHDDTKITVYQSQDDSTGTRITHPRCNHYPTSSKGDVYASIDQSRSFIDVCRDNRYDFNSAKYI